MFPRDTYCFFGRNRKLLCLFFSNIGSIFLNYKIRCTDVVTNSVKILCVLTLEGWFHIQYVKINAEIKIMEFRFILLQLFAHVQEITLQQNYMGVMC